MMIRNSGKAKKAVTVALVCGVVLCLALCLAACGSQQGQADQADQQDQATQKNQAELHVATDGSDESGNGTPDEPYATISFAAGSAPGSVIIVHGGEYGPGELDAACSGMEDSPTVIRAAEGERPVIHAEEAAVAADNLRVAVDDGVGLDLAPVAELDVGADHGVGSDGDVLPDPGFGGDDGGGVDVRHGARSGERGGRRGSPRWRPCRRR